MECKYWGHVCSLKKGIKCIRIILGVFNNIECCRVLYRSSRIPGHNLYRFRNLLTNHLRKIPGRWRQGIVPRNDVTSIDDQSECAKSHSWHFRFLFRRKLTTTTNMACFDKQQVHLALLPGLPQMFTVTRSNVLVLVLSAVMVLVLVGVLPGLLTSKLVRIELLAAGVDKGSGVADAIKRSDVCTAACSLARRRRPEFQAWNLDDETHHSPEFVDVSRADEQGITSLFSVNSRRRITAEQSDGSSPSGISGCW